MKETVTATISTKDRYFTTLSVAMASIVHQTVPPDVFILFDDGERRDLRHDPVFGGLFHVMDSKGIQWKVVFGEGKGQVLNHQRAIEISETDWIWRLDDDDYAEPDVLQKLLSHTADPKVGGVAGCVLMPQMGGGVYSNAGSGKIEDIYTRPNVQWFRSNTVQKIEHFHNTFMFRRSAAGHGYCTELSPVGHREETIFSHEFVRNGWELIFDPGAVTWHFRDPNGGIRSHNSKAMYDGDEAVFSRKLAAWKVLPVQNKLIVLNNGIGDHLAFSMVLPKIKERFRGQKLLLAVCYPEVFADDKDVELLSIADAMAMANTDDFCIYRWMDKHNWRGRLYEAFDKFYS